MKKIFYLIGVLFCSVTLWSQELRSSLQGLRSGDVLIKQQVSYPVIAFDDTCKLWDFSRVKSINDNYCVTFDVEKDTLITAREHQTIYKYEISGDTLYLSGYQTATTRMEYIGKEVILPFPIREGTHFEGRFWGEGDYCGKMILHTAGHIQITTGVAGKLILPDADTLTNVLRVESLKKSAEEIIPVSGADSASVWDINKLFRKSMADSTGMCVKTIRWYAEGTRYPVFETVESSGRKDSEPYIHFQTAFMYYPENQYYDLPEDPENNRIRILQEEQSDMTPSSAKIQSAEWKYSLEKTADRLTINLILERSLPVRMSILDISGKLRLQKPEHLISEGYNQEIFDLSSLYAGEYLLVITVGDKMVSEKFMK